MVMVCRKVHALKIICICLAIVVSIIAIVSMTAIGLFIYKVMTVENGEFFTQDPSEYNVHNHPNYSPIFTEKISENAEVVSYTHYKYWGEAIDIYLELKFDTREELDAYLNTLKTNVVRHSEGYEYLAKQDSCLVEEQNPYDSKYIDLFYLYHHATSNGKSYTGYEIAFEENYTLYCCNFGIISYSYEDLTVIQTYATGWFRPSKHGDYVPQYLIRFQIPLDQEQERFFYLKD